MIPEEKNNKHTTGGNSSGDFARILHGRSSHRNEYASSAAAFLLLFTMIFIVRFGANIYLAFYFHTGGGTLDYLQITGSLLFCLSAYIILSGTLQAHRCMSVLPQESQFLFLPNGRRFYRLVRNRIYLMRPLTLFLFAVLAVSIVLLALLAGAVGAVLFHAAVISVITIAGFIFLVRIAEKLKITRIETRLIEIIGLAALVLANPDYGQVNGKNVLLFWGYHLPHGRLLFSTGAVAAVVVVILLFFLLLRLGDFVHSAVLRSSSFSPVTAVYFRIIRPWYWVVLYTAAFVVSININVEERMAMIVLTAAAAAAVCIYFLFVFQFDSILEEEWNMKITREENRKLLFPPAVIHLFLSCLPFIFLLLDR